MAELDDQSGGIEESPWHINNAPGLILIQQMRLYDLLMGIYREMNPELADKLLELHNDGKTLLTPPYYS